MAPATTPKRMSREARHASLLDAAAVILRAGEHPLTFETVAAVAGVSPTLPYKYFASVDAIASELYGQLIGPIDEQTESLMADPAQTFDEKLRATLHLWCDILRTDGALLLRLSDDVAHPSLRKVIDARRERSVQVLADEIERECEIDPTTARLVAGSISGGSIAALRRWIVDRLDREAMIEGFVVLAGAQLDAVRRGAPNQFTLAAKRPSSS